ncbi:hypothetical protein VMCG_08381 [Cytospora schulzeri]|uniref:Uncharacterized protein n=1 Tax=Cytospora schulzeri TaxID=448051 RepID=A0A423VQT3_9PEZI|nr:hypothetical protein VMCG_08381 [Valsa malicola]
MASYKRVENRKYNQGEIDYVLSRAQAGWDNETIAKTFKLDHAEYWGEREFNKKQVAYIRSNYKVPWGMIDTYKGPMPQFSESPTTEFTQGPSTRAQQKGKQAARRSEGTPSRTQDLVTGPTSNFNLNASAQRQQQTQTFGDATAGPSSTSGGDFFGLNASSTGLASGDLDFCSFNFPNDEFTRGSPQVPSVSNAEFLGMLPGQQGAPQKAARGSNVNQGFSGNTIQMGNTAHTGAFSQTSFGNETPSTSGVGLGVKIGDGFGQTTDVSDSINLLANVPIPSVERQLPATPATVHGFQANIGNDTISNTPGQQQQPPAQVQAAFISQFPPGYTATNHMFRDTHGVWYYDPHDSCTIALGHRHDWDGGVYFSGDLGVTQSFSNMNEQEGIGFLLGLAAAQALHAAGPSQERLFAATELARGALPEGTQGREGVTVPSPEIVQRLMAVNRELPGNYYYEPFTNRVVQYDMPAGLAAQNGKQSENAGRGSNQGASTSGGPAQ